jgi:hypothetical protein
MPGKLGANFRRGHLAEDLGVFFLRSFSAVADLRQEDDFGLDAIATLLSRRGGILYAEESFAVQIKAISVEKIEYEGEALEWLLRQHLPLFFLSVDLDEGIFHVYTANPVYELFVRQEIVSAKVLFATPDTWYSRLKLTDNHADVYVGPPILSSEIGKLNDPEHLQKVYSLMKVWVASEINQAGFRALNKSRIMRWKTWEKPESGGVVSRGATLNLRRDMRMVEPYISYLASHVINLDAPDLGRAFLTLKDWFEEFGVETDLDENELRGLVRSNPLTREELLMFLGDEDEDT